MKKQTKREEQIIYSIGAVGFIIIAFYYLKSGVTIDSILLVFKDFIPIFLTLWLFKTLDGMRASKSYEKAAEKAIEMICRRPDKYLEDSSEKNGKKTERYLYFIKTKTSFIPIELLRKGTLEVRISYGTLENFGYSIKGNDSEKEDKISKVKTAVKEEVMKTLYDGGVRFNPPETIKESENNIAVRIIFAPEEEGFQRIVETVVENVITLLKNKQGY